MSDEEHARKAAAILREGQPLDPEEQAAQQVVKEHLWVLWHAKDVNLGVIRLLHRARLLRDPDHERREREHAISDANYRERVRVATGSYITTLEAIITSAVDALRAGHDPAAVADQMTATARRASDARDRATRHQAAEETP